MFYVGFLEIDLIDLQWSKGYAEGTTMRESFLLRTYWYEPFGWCDPK